MIGLLGLLNWQVTVISSNFAAILLIITMSMTIHLAVRYRELKAKDLNLTKKDAVSETIHYMFVPCVYTSLTTIVAFISLVVSGIRPVIDFGYLMTFGIISAFIISPTCKLTVSPIHVKSLYNLEPISPIKT